MINKEKLYNSIKHDGETVFFHNLKQNKEKLELFNKAKKEGKITNFDPNVIRKLRKLYYGFYSGLIYMYYEPTDHRNLPNRAELLTHVMKEKDYKLVHGTTESTRNIPFFMYGVEHLDCNSWLEVKEGNKEWVYDLFSLLKIEKNVYYELEEPFVIKQVPKSSIMSLPGREEDEYDTHHDGADFMLVEIIPEMEKNMKTHPFKDILMPELDRYKYEIDFDRIVLENLDLKRRNR